MENVGKEAHLKVDTLLLGDVLTSLFLNNLDLLLEHIVKSL